MLGNWYGRVFLLVVASVSAARIAIRKDASVRVANNTSVDGTQVALVPLGDKVNPLSISPFGACPADNAVCVAIRFRPPNPGQNCLERLKATPSLCEDVATTLNTKDCSRCVEVDDNGKSKLSPFDVILPWDTALKTAPTNVEVAQTLVKPMMDAALACKIDGQTCQGSAFFAYGATGSGKTFTMGFEAATIESNPGQLQLGMQMIYDELEVLKQSSSAKQRKLGSMRIWMAFFEVYGRKGSLVYDLLKSKKGDGMKGSQDWVRKDLTYKEVPNLAAMNAAFLKGNKQRETGATGMNAKSSRSHALVQFFMVNPEYDLAKLKGTPLVNVLKKSTSISWIDLAGSEKPTWMDEKKWPGLKMSVRKQRTEEGQTINTGLSMLAACIGKTAGMSAHCSERADMLTEMMSHTFKTKNGKALTNTRLIATMNPSADPEQIELTKSTLTFAGTVKKIKLGLPTGTSTSDLVTMSPSEIIADLQQQIAELKETNLALQQENNELKSGLPETSGTDENSLTVDEMLQQAARLREEKLDLESRLEDCISKPAPQLEVPEPGGSSSEEVALLEAQLALVSKNLEHVTAAWHTTQAEAKTLKEQVDAPSDKVLFLTEELQKLQKFKQEHKHNEGRLENLVTNLRDQIKKAEEDAQDCRDTVSGLETSMELQSAQLQDAHEELAALRQIQVDTEALASQEEQEDPCELAEKTATVLQAVTNDQQAELVSKFQGLEDLTALQIQRTEKITQVEQMVLDLKNRSQATGNIFNKIGPSGLTFADEIEPLVGKKLAGKGAATRFLLNPERALIWLKETQNDSEVEESSLRQGALALLAEMQRQTRKAGSAETGQWRTGLQGKQDVFAQGLKKVDSSLQVALEYLNPSKAKGTAVSSKFLETLEENLRETLCNSIKDVLDGNTECAAETFEIFSANCPA